MPNQNNISVDSIFYKGKLFQVGDIVNTNIEYLDIINSQGFVNSVNNSLVLKDIVIEPDSIVNSCFVNHGFTNKNGLGGLSYSFIVGSGDNNNNNKRVFAFECDLIDLSLFTNKKDKIRFFDSYYNIPLNKAKRDNLVMFFNIPLTIKNIGSFIYKINKNAFDFIYCGFEIRYGVYGNNLYCSDSLTKTFTRVYESKGFDKTNRVGSMEYNLTMNNMNNKI